jgi:hypothetical protein
MKWLASSTRVRLLLEAQADEGSHEAARCWISVAATASSAHDCGNYR